MGAGWGVLAFSGAVRLMSAHTQALPGAKKLIDVNHHIVPPFYLAESRDKIVTAGGGRINPAYLAWTPEQALAAMDKHGVGHNPTAFVLKEKCGSPSFLSTSDRIFWTRI